MINSFTKEVTTLATCWRIKLRNGRILGFTDFVQDITFDSIVYKSQSGFYSSAIEMNSGLIIDNFEISGFLNSDLINKQEVLTGFFDYAQIQVIVVNYQNPELGRKIITSGYFGKIRIKDSQFFTEIAGLVSFLDNTVSKIYSPTCRAQFCDNECQVINKLTVLCTIIAIHNDYEIDIDKNIENHLYGYGTFKVHDQECFVKNCNRFKVIVVDKLPETIKLGDPCILIAGCDKQFSTCCDQYNNAINFRGEPHIPCIEELV